MDPDNNKGQLRQFKDFLQLYNTITEKCFSSCVDNLFTRDVSESEDSCIIHCVNKFANVNQRLMGTYVEIQTQLNTKRMAEYEENLKLQQEQQAAAAASAITEVETSQVTEVPAAI
ncbi:unnamed protein product [Diamesa hyperborea]